ncbi:MAG: 4-hydroxy-tetrahydrodipicolinate reductase, partial [Alphaproteobacteria bacterium]
MADMKIGIIGAGGRMGQACIRQVTDTDGCAIVAASDIRGSALIGQDAGDAAGAGTLGVAVTDDAAAVVAASDTIIEFTLPGPTVNHVALTAEAGIAHIIGTTGMEGAQEAALKAAG